jgi:hypothetical protein
MLTASVLLPQANVNSSKKGSKNTSTITSSDGNIGLGIPDGGIEPVAMKGGKWSRGTILHRNQSTDLDAFVDSEGALGMDEGGARLATHTSAGVDLRPSVKPGGLDGMAAEEEEVVGKGEEEEPVVVNPLMQQVCAADAADAAEAAGGVSAAVDATSSAEHAVSSGVVIPFMLALQEAKAAEEEAWAEVLVHDELIQCMARNEVFAGFKEEAIAFPPSYRRMRGLEGDCGDYCDQAQLESAFSTEVKGAGTRIPSYTDRILLHSIADVQHRIKCCCASTREDGSSLPAYYICNALVESDHRPVCAEYELTTGMRQSASSSKQPSRLSKAPLEYTVIVTGLGVDWDAEEVMVEEGGEEEQKDDEDEDEEEAKKKEGGGGGGSVELTTPGGDATASTDLTSASAALAVPLGSGSKTALTRPGSKTALAGSTPSHRDPMQRRGSGAGARLRAMTASLQHSQPQEPLDRNAGLTVTAQFPLPSEDIFSAQRKMHLIQVWVGAVVAAVCTRYMLCGCGWVQC